MTDVGVAARSLGHLWAGTPRPCACAPPPGFALAVASSLSQARLSRVGSTSVGALVAEDPASVGHSQGTPQGTATCPSSAARTVPRRRHRRGDARDRQACREHHHRMAPPSRLNEGPSQKERRPGPTPPAPSTPTRLNEGPPGRNGDSRVALSLTTRLPGLNEGSQKERRTEDALAVDEHVEASMKGRPRRNGDSVTRPP